MKDKMFENVDWINGILEFSSTGLWRIKINNNTGINKMYASQSMLKLLGLEQHPSEEECYMHWWENIDEDYRSYVESGVQQMLTTGEQIEIQYLWNHPKLQKIFVRCSGKLEKDENGVLELRGYHQNLSEIELFSPNSSMSAEEQMKAAKLDRLKLETKRLDEQTRGLRGLLRKFLENTSTLEFYYYPKERRRVFPDDVWSKYDWGNECSNMPYSFSEEHVEPKYREAYEEMYEKIHNGAETASCIVAFKGKSTWFNTTMTVIEHDEEGQPTFVVGIAEDISEKHLRKIENMELQTICNFAVNNDYEVIAVVDLDRGEYSLRYSDKDQHHGALISRSIIGEIDDDLRTKLSDSDTNKLKLDSIVDSLNNVNEGTYTISYQIEDGDHKEACCCWFEKNSKMLITVRNVEKRWKEEAESRQKIMEALEVAQKANRAKSEFLSRMSHDIRTPLNAVIGMSAVARKHIDDVGRVGQCLDSINNSSNYLLMLINDILDMSKIENGKLILSEEDFAIDEFIPKMLDIVKPLIENKKHHFEVDYHEIKHTRVCGDATHLQQILMNVLSNAIKYTNPGGEISLRVCELTSQKEGYGCYQFRVKDNGIGMKKSFLPQLFNPFERMDSQRVGRVEGTGLGMAIAKSIANMMDGDIEVESELNKGSEFFITVNLKLQGHQYHKDHQTGGKKEIPDFKGRNVLLVEDNMINIAVAEEILSETNVNVKVAENGAEAVSMMKKSVENYYSMIFMDIRMPIMNGYKAAAIIRDIDRIDSKEIPIIAMTADAFAEDIKRAKDSGMNDHIAKPIDVDKLYELMRRWMPQ